MSSTPEAIRRSATAFWRRILGSIERNGSVVFSSHSRRHLRLPPPAEQARRPFQSAAGLRTKTVWRGLAAAMDFLRPLDATSFCREPAAAQSTHLRVRYEDEPWGICRRWILSASRIGAVYAERIPGPHLRSSLAGAFRKSP